VSARLATLPKPRAPDRGAPRQRLLATATRRRAAKAGMALSLGVLVWSALGGRRLLRRYHVLAGVALLGFTAWHMSLYPARDAAGQDSRGPR
jgi:hypothetical protein